MAVVGTAQVLIVPTFEGLQKSIGRGLLKPLDDHTRAADPGKQIGNRIVGGLGTALKVGAATTIAAGAGLMATALVQGFGRLRSLENARATLEGLGHDAQNVQGIMDDALAAVKGTAFGMGEAATAAASAVAAGVKPGADLQRTLTLMGDAATIAGVDITTMGSIVNKVATSDMMQMDVANQLMDAGIPILQMVADEMGVTAEEARKMASAGEVSFETFQNALEEGVGGAAQRSGETLTGAFANTKASLGRVGASLLEPFYGMATDFLNWAMDMLGPVEEWAESIKPLIQDGLENFADWIQDSFIPAAKNVIDTLKDIGEWIVNNKDWLIPLTVAVGAFVAAFMGVLAVKSAIDSVRTGFMLLNAVMAANPIGLVIAAVAALAAGLVWFFTQTETGQKIWDSVTTFMKDTWDWVVDSVAWAWENVLKPAWDAVSDAATWLWEKVLSPVFAWIGEAWENWTNHAKWAWDNILKPVWDAVAAAATWLWDTILSPIFSWIGENWDDILTGMKIAWDHILKPAWDDLKSSISDLWNNTLQPTFTWISDKWNEVMGNVKSFWDTIGRPVFDSISALLKGDFVAAWEHAKDAIAGIWNKVMEIAAKPIDFVINTVYNNGIRKVFNAIADLIDIKSLPEYPGIMNLIPAYAKGGHYKGGLALVGEEGPELINFDRPGYVHTASETADIARQVTGDGKHDVPESMEQFLVGRRPQDALVPAGDGFWGNLWKGTKKVAGSVWDATGGAVLDWARGKLADTALLVVNPLKDTIESWIGTKPGFNGMITQMSHGMLDDAVKWIRGKDEEKVAAEAAGGSYAGGYDGPLGAFRHPGHGPITSRFGPRWGGMHAGIDFAMPVGSAVRAAFDGVVQHARWNAVPGRTGKGMVLGHGGGRNTYYGHLNHWVARPGDEVKAGQTIALSGNTGNSTGPHLHFEKWRGGLPINPGFLFRDQGGNLPPGLSMVLNNTGRDEAILNAQQWSDIHALATRNAGSAGVDPELVYAAMKSGIEDADIIATVTDNVAARLHERGKRVAVARGAR